MNKYLLEILQEANTIIIPGLGALTITDKEKGEIMFMSYLKHDDGKLSGYIAQKDGIDEADAKNLIAKYVREIQTSLDKGESFDMFEFGTFSKNDGGDVEFTAAIKGGDETSKTDEVKSQEKKKEVPVEKEKTEIKPDVTKIETKIEAPKKELEKVAEKIVTPKKEVTKAKETLEKKVAPIVKKVAVSTSPTSKTEKKITPVVPIIPKSDSPKNSVKELKKEIPKTEAPKKESVKKAVGAAAIPASKTTKKKKKRGIGFWILIVLLLLILGGGTYFGINYDELKQHVPFLADEKAEDTESNALDEMRETLGEGENDSNTEENTEESSDENETIDETVEDPVEETIEETPRVENTTPPTTSGSGPYHIIAGAFSSQANADRLAKKLQGEGLPASVILNGGMHTVSMKSFASAADANASLTEMKGYSSGAWVLFKQ